MDDSKEIMALSWDHELENALKKIKLKRNVHGGRLLVVLFHAILPPKFTVHCAFLRVNRILQPSKVSVSFKYMSTQSTYNFSHRCNDTLPFRNTSPLSIILNTKIITFRKVYALNVDAY